jgi:chorismate dehydratase
MELVERRALRRGQDTIPHGAFQSRLGGTVLSSAGLMSIRLSCVSFLNALPFVEGFRLLPPELSVEVLLDPPYVCAERLSRGEVHGALVPSFEFFRMPSAVRAGGLGISSANEVRSVILVASKPLKELRRVAVDLNSRTSVALLKLLLSTHGSKPEMIPMMPDPVEMLRRCDGALLIGDAALRATTRGDKVLDLAAAWFDMTGLPFVFAVWAARDAESAARIAPRIETSLSLGLGRLSESAARACSRIGLSAPEIEDYINRNIHYRIGRRELLSLGRFEQMCRDEGLLGTRTGSSS